MDDIHSARHFFLQVVIPAYRDLGRVLMDGTLGDKRDLLAAGRASEACLHLADYVAREPVAIGRVDGAPKSRPYVKDLASRFRCFAIARDMANAVKHRKITDQSRTLEGVESLMERWALIRFSDDQGVYWATRKAVIVRLIGGGEVLAEDVLMQCISAWSTELVRLQIIPQHPYVERLPRLQLARSEVPLRPTILMLACVGEYFESQPVLLNYNVDRDALEPIFDGIGSVEVDVEMRVSPSPFVGRKEPSDQVHRFTLLVADNKSPDG